MYFIQSMCVAPTPELFFNLLFTVRKRDTLIHCDFNVIPIADILKGGT